MEDAPLVVAFHSDEYEKVYRWPGHAHFNRAHTCYIASINNDILPVIYLTSQTSIRGLRSLIHDQNLH